MLTLLPFDQGLERNYCYFYDNQLNTACPVKEKSKIDMDENVSYLHLRVANRLSCLLHGEIPAASQLLYGKKKQKGLEIKGKGKFFGSLEAVTDDVVKIAKSF